MENQHKFYWYDFSDKTKVINTFNIDENFISFFEKTPQEKKLNNEDKKNLNNEENHSLEKKIKLKVPKNKNEDENTPLLQEKQNKKSSDKKQSYYENAILEKRKNKFVVVTESINFRRDFKKLYKQNWSSDIKFNCKTKVFYGHSIICKLRSPSLNRILENMKPTETKEEENIKYVINLEDHFPKMKPKYFNILLRYMYKGKLKAPKPGYELGLFKTSKMLELSEAANTLSAYLGTYLDPMDAFKLIGSALETKNYALFQVCAKYIEDDNESLFDIKNDKKMNVIMEWPVMMIAHFVSVGNVTIPEQDIFQIAKLYVEHNARKHNMEPIDMFKKYFESEIRYPLMKPEVLLTEVCSTNWVDEKFITEAFKYNAISRELRSTLSSTRTQERLRNMKMRWVVVSGSQKIDLSNGDKTITKSSTGSGWNAVATVELTKKVTTISVRVDHTNSDRSGMAIGIIGDNVKTQFGSYSQTVGTQYNKPTSCNHGNPIVNTTYTWVVDTVKDFIEISINGKSQGKSPKKPSSLVKPLHLAAFLYYNANKVTIV